MGDAFDLIKNPIYCFKRSHIKEVNVKGSLNYRLFKNILDTLFIFYYITKLNITLHGLQLSIDSKFNI